MKKRNLTPTLTLGIICIAVALLLGLVNSLTREKILNDQIEAVSASLRVVMPDGSFADSEPIPSDAPDTVTGIYKDLGGKGHAVTLSTSKGYTGKPILITVGVDSEGKIIKAVVTETNESKITDEINLFPDRFTGIGGGGIDSVDTVAGVTVSSTAIKSAIKDALAVLGYAEVSEDKDSDEGVRGPVTRSDEEIYNLALALLPGAEKLEEITLDGSDPTLIKAFKEPGSNRHVFYVATGAWGRLESEGLIAADNLGNVTDINFLTWNVGHGVEYTEEYVESFKGKNKDSLMRVELVSSATATSVSFRAAVAKALEAAYPIPVYTVIASVLTGAVALGIVIPLTVKAVKKRKEEKK